MIVKCSYCNSDVKRKPSEICRTNFCDRKCMGSFREEENTEGKLINKRVNSMWINMNIRAGKYRHLQTKSKCSAYDNVSIEFTRAEFKEWIISNKDLLFTLERPSLDRIESSKNYSLDNIQLLELSDNIRKKRNGNEYMNGQKENILRGVRPEGKKFSARITVNRKEVHIGTFETKKEAYIAFYNKYIEYWNKEPFSLDLVDTGA